jgi:hypothetical protein
LSPLQYFLDETTADLLLLFGAEYLPISDSNSYDNTRKVCNVSKILTPQFTLDVAKYKACHIPHFRL